MNDVMTSLDAACTLFLKVAVGIVLLCFSRVCLAYANKQKGTVVLPTTTVTTSSTQATIAPLAPIAPVIAPAKLVAQPAPPEPIEVIECGNCGKEIRSEPVNQVMDPPAEVYKCENCGAQVQVPL